MKNRFAELSFFSRWFAPPIPFRTAMIGLSRPAELRLRARGGKQWSPFDAGRRADDRQHPAQCATSISGRDAGASAYIRSLRPAGRRWHGRTRPRRAWKDRRAQGRETAARAC